MTLFSYGFMQNALLAGTVLSVLCGVVGYFVVLRHGAFAGEALADVGFTGALGGTVLGIAPLAAMFGATLLAAGAMAAIGTRLREREVATGIVLAFVLGLGVLFLSIFASGGARGGGASGLTVLFGSMLSISTAQMVVITVVAVVVLSVLAGISRPLFFASVDPDVAVAKGVPVRALGLVFMGLLALTVVEAAQAVGVLLVFALLLLPAAAAHRLTTRPSVGVFLAVALTVSITWAGLATGFYSGLPVSVSISLLAFGVYAASEIAQRGLRRTRKSVTPPRAA